MAAVDPEDLEAILTERRHFAQKTLDQYGGLRESYQDWNKRVQVIDQIQSGNWVVVWPDNKADEALPKIPNYPRLAHDHRVYLAGQTMPTLAIRPSKNTDDAKSNAEKRERIITGWQANSNVPLLIPEWAGNVVDTGLCAVKVLPDMSKPKGERFPLYCWVNPRHLYPSPMFARGPFLDDAIIAYEEKANTVGRMFGKEAEISSMLKSASRYGQSEANKVRLIEYHDEKVTMVIAEAMYRADPGKRKPFEVLVYEEHNLGRCPVTIGTTASHDGVYRSQLSDGLAMLNTANRLMTFHLHEAELKVYPTMFVKGNVEEERDWGPAAILRGDERSSIEYVVPPPAPYDNYQVMRQLDSYLRAAFLLPPSLTGDPNESVTSAAGINATQALPNAAVVAIQRHAIAPMLQAANEVAIRADEKWADTEKTISGVSKGATFVEKYRPSKDFNGDYTNSVSYGLGAGVDATTAHVALMQAKGEGLISDQTAREKDPWVDDPQLEKNQIAIEQLEKAAFSGIIASAAAPPGDPRALTLDQIAAIWEDLERGIHLKDAIKNHMTPEQAPLAPVPQTGPPALASPGIAGAGEPQPPSFEGAPPLEELLGA